MSEKILVPVLGESLNEATVLGWVKAQIGTELCAEWERDVSYETKKGKPF